MKKILFYLTAGIFLFQLNSCIVRDDNPHYYNDNLITTTQIANSLIGEWEEVNCVNFTIPCGETWDNYNFNGDGTFYFNYYDYEGMNPQNEPIYLEAGNAAGNWYIYKNTYNHFVIALDYITNTGTVEDDEFILNLTNTQLKIENVDSGIQKTFFR